MKINTKDALLSKLMINQFLFETLKSYNTDVNTRFIKQCLNACKVVECDINPCYRARSIEDNEEIIFDEGIPQNGFDPKGSGVAPIEKCDIGRVNKKREQVLYVASDVKTAIEELKSTCSYYSVASCIFPKGVYVYDFSLITEKEILEFSRQQRPLWKQQSVMPWDCVLFSFLLFQRVFTMPFYAEEEYLVSRKLASWLKADRKVSGMKYRSYYTKGINMAIWDENKYIPFTEGKPVHYVASREEEN